MLRWLGKKVDMYPKDIDLAWECDYLLDGFFDVFNKVIAFLYETDPDRKKFLAEEMHTKILPIWFKVLHNKLEKK